jgi:hypothetical protein
VPNYQTVNPIDSINITCNKFNIQDHGLSFT